MSETPDFMPGQVWRSDDDIEPNVLFIEAVQHDDPRGPKVSGHALFFGEVMLYRGSGVGVTHDFPVLMFSPRKDPKALEREAAQAAVEEWHRLNLEVVRRFEAGDIEGMHEASLASKAFAELHPRPIAAERARLDMLDLPFRNG